MQLIQPQGFGQGLLGEGLFGEHGCDAVGTLLALRWVQQNELLNLLQLFYKAREDETRKNIRQAFAGPWNRQTTGGLRLSAGDARNSGKELKQATKQLSS
jgi:hypothetical protein